MTKKVATTKKAGENEAEHSRNLADEEHDEGALRKADERMLLRDRTDSAVDGAEGPDEDVLSEPDGEHDAGALKEASERMLLRHDLR
jgi:hypothetical protein